MRFGLVVAATSLTLLGGCAGVYRPYSYWMGNDSGYKEEREAINRWYIRYYGNRSTDWQRSVDFAYLRAAEVTIQSGYRYFKVRHDTTKGRSRAVINQGTTTAKTTIAADCSGNYNVTCQGTATTTYTHVPPSAYAYESGDPVTYLFVDTYHETLPGTGDYFDAAEVMRDLKARYKIKK